MIELENSRIHLELIGYGREMDDEIELMKEAIRELTREVMKRERTNPGHRSSW